MNAFIQFLRAFSKWCHDFGTLIILPLMALLITTDVTLRYFFNRPLAWGEEVNGLMLFLVLMLSMTYAWDMDKHIRMELVYVKLKGRWRAFADIMTGITGVIFFGFLGVQSFRDIDYMYRTNESSEVLAIPLWPFRALIVVISLIFVIKLLYYILAGRKEVGEVQVERDGVVIQKETH